MPRIVLAECMQEISSFNPLPSEYENFAIQRGEDMLRQRGQNTTVGGLLDVFAARPDITVVPTMGARAGSAGLLSAKGWSRLRQELLDAIRPALPGADAILVSLHGAMGADGELDPEGDLLEAIRQMAGPDLPIVISLDLHGILTDRMLRQIDGLAIYNTYPHVDFADTGARAARVLLRLLDERIHPAIARVVIPALVRGDELITRTGCYGDLIRECQRLEREGKAIAAGVMIGNPFTDVPELCSQVLVMSTDPAVAQKEAVRLAEEFWPNRHRMQGKFISLERAIAQARTMRGPVVFTDAPDATSSGATGDSNLILRALIEAGYEKRVLAQIVDAPAATKAHEAGVGATISVTLGGTHDPARFKPLAVAARVKLLSDGGARLETSGNKLEAGPTAVLEIGNITVVVLSRSVSLFDRALYYSNGLDPQKFDLIVVKSPHTEYQMYDAWVEKNFNLDIPGATSANLPTLGHTICARPVFPLDSDVQFEPAPRLYTRTAARAAA
jgi:microcystin degradation protein MlrC